MNTPVMKERVAEGSQSLNGGFAVVFYLLTIVAGGLVFFVNERLGFIVVTACYLSVTALFYDLFKPASRILSLPTEFCKRLRQIAERSTRVRKEVRRTI
jgi:hypothetical protein